MSDATTLHLRGSGVRLVHIDGFEVREYWLTLHRGEDAHVHVSLARVLSWEHDVERGVVNLLLEDGSTLRVASLDRSPERKFEATNALSDALFNRIHDEQTTEAWSA